MFQNSWSIKLEETPEFLTLASLPSSSFVYQGASNKLSVFINNQTHSLPIRKQVIALATINDEHILILTKYNLVAFHLLNNQELFSLQFENAEKLFVINDTIYITSGPSLYCYNQNGEQIFVNHISSNILTITNVESNSGLNSDQIIIATSDMTMFRYSKMNIIFDYAKIIGNATSLCWIGKGVLVGTEEGSIAYYESKKYKWKAKSVHRVCSILKFKQISKYSQNAQFQEKKEDKIIIVRNDGNIELRDWENGATLTKIKAGENVISAFVTDFRKQGVNQIVCSLQSGLIKAFNLVDQKKDPNAKNGTVDQTIQVGDELQRLTKQKQDLIFKIGQLKNQISEKGGNEDNNDQKEVVSPDFSMSASLNYKNGLLLQITANNGYISGMSFEQSLMPIFVDKVQSFHYKFENSAKIAGDMVCQLMVHSSQSATKYEIRRIPILLTKFWKWGLQPKPKQQISGRLKFKLIQRNSRYFIWLKQCFLINISKKEQQRLQNQSEMKFRFSNWYENKEMEVIFSQTNGTVSIISNCLKTMGEIFQDLINFVGIKNLNSELDFPQEKEKIKKLLETVESLSQNKVNSSSELADSINTIKFLLVKGENSRVVGSMNDLRKTYGQIMQLNRNMVIQVEKKNANMKVLTETLKNVNNFINQIANVRYGQAKNQVIAKCREAIKTKRFPQIYRIMDKGSQFQ